MILTDFFSAVDRLLAENEVLIVVGRRDAIVGYEDQRALSQRFGRATYAALDRAGHNVRLDQPHVVRRLLGDWLRRVKQGSTVRSTLYPVTDESGTMLPNGFAHDPSRLCSAPPRGSG